MTKEPCCNPELVRRHEELILSNKISLEDFIARYDRDRQECAQRYKEDREEARKWRELFDFKLTHIDDFISQLRPNYKVMLYFVGTIFVSALALIFRIIWTHISDGK